MKIPPSPPVKLKFQENFSRLVAYPLFKTHDDSAMLTKSNVALPIRASNRGSRLEPIA